MARSNVQNTGLQSELSSNLVAILSKEFHRKTLVIRFRGQNYPSSKASMQGKSLIYRFELSDIEQWFGWPDFGVPLGEDEPGIDQIVKQMKQVIDSKHPVVVHCNFGV
jgi:hypothetical protein